MEELKEKTFTEDREDMPQERDRNEKHKIQRELSKYLKNERN